jgi:NAD+ kinase
MVIGVLPNLDKRGAFEVLEKLGSILTAANVEAYVSDKIMVTGFKQIAEEELFKISDVIITIGGDGTIMRYSKIAASEGKPVLGINAGRMGYLANLEQNELDLINKLLTGEYTVEDRMLMSVTVKENGNVIGEYTALNDAVVTSGFISRIIDISAGVGNDYISYRADGLIVSTPTGSTAYSMSAGGPIIDPATESFCVTPICSHSLSAKPIILGANNEIKVKAFSKKRTEIYLTVDGRKVANMRPFTEVYIKQSENNVKLIRLNDRSFYKTLSYKFKDGRSM